MSETQDHARQTVLYKILTEAEFAALPTPDASGHALFKGTKLDENDGFIHTSNAHQLAGTLDRFFKDAQRVWILAIPRTENMEETHGLKFDKASNGDHFGHLYKPFDVLQEVAVRRPVKRDADGNWDVGLLEF